MPKQQGKRGRKTGRNKRKGAFLRWCSRHPVSSTTYRKKLSRPGMQRRMARVTALEVATTLARLPLPAQGPLAEAVARRLRRSLKRLAAQGAPRSLHPKTEAKIGHAAHATIQAASSARVLCQCHA